MKTIRVLVKNGDAFHEASTYGTRKPAVCLNQEVERYLTFKVALPLEAGKKQNLEFYCEKDGLRIRLQNLQYGRYFPISDKYARNFYATKEWILTQDNETLMLSPRRIGSFLWHELQLCQELLATKHKIARNSVLSRLLLHVLKPFKRKPIWLISDRASKAGDNGEAFFRYVRENHPEIDARFVINGDCPDYAAMQKIGPVVKKDSFVHKILHLLSDCVISSHGEVDIYNPFYRSYEPYRNLLAKDKYVFLQHGIIKDDLSGWLKRNNKKLSGFITAAIPEHSSILDGAYEYNERQVWLTVFPRFDRLYKEEEKWITIMPTWRAYLMGTHDLHNGTRVLKAGTENSEYVAFYNSLLNNERLCAAARQYGYQLKFLPHPEMQIHLDVFEKNSAVDYLGYEMEYREIYAKSNLVITDYSSAVFDFAYLRKPVMYLHFDADEFFCGNHVYTKGYFDYERDGLGEVEYDLDSTVDRIIEYMENGCQLKDKYRERIDNFFAFNDQNNCQRVFEKIMELQQ